MPVYLAPLPATIRRDVASLAADVIELAARLGERRWGATPYADGIRVNVGWTEILTALPDHLRLIVDRGLAQTAVLPLNAVLTPGDNPTGFYPSVPGSVLAEISYTPIGKFRKAVEMLGPALARATELAARRGAGRGVQEGHRQQLVTELSSVAGRTLPAPTESVVGADDSGPRLMEGALHRVTSSEYERNPAARRACIEHFGHDCQACGFSFEALYGPAGAHFIHVHHVRPVSTRGRSYQVDPVRDLIPVCPNCHAMLHRLEPPMSIDELRNLIFKPHEA